MEQILQALASQYQGAMSWQGAAWHLTLPSRGSFTCKLVVPDGPIEWYIDIYDVRGGSRVWGDSMDYLGYNNRSEAELIEDKRRDIAWFVSGWFRATSVRITHKRDTLLWGLWKPQHVEAEWEQDQHWEEVQIYDPTR